jgi:hypothetical protein
MKKTKFIFLIAFLICILSLKSTLSFAGYVKKIKQKVYVISIGISNKNDSIPNFNNGFYFLNECKACLSDASGIVNYISKLKSVDTVIKYEYINSNINIDTLYKTFSDVQKKATASDIFMFYYAGISWGKMYNTELSSNEGFYALNKINTYQDINNNSFTLRTLKVLTDRIAAQRQLIVFDAGEGGIIENDYYKNFFSANPIDAYFTKKNRVVICPENFSFESYDKKEGIIKGDLYKVISNMPDSLNIFNLFDTSYKKSSSTNNTTYKRFM